MKKITLLALLMWSSLFYGQTYLSEGFESGLGSWASVAGSGTDPGNNWVATTLRANFGAQSAYFNDFAGTNNRWLISPAMDLSSTADKVLTYYENLNHKDFVNTNHVSYTLNYTGDPATTTWVALNLVEGIDAEDTWTIRGTTFDNPLPKGAGAETVVIGFQYIGTNASEWYIDDVFVRDTPTCIEPSAGSISNVMTTSADFGWTKGPGGTEVLWDVNLLDITGGDSDPDVDGTTTSTGTNPFSFSSLTPGNSYAAYVRADCGGGDTSGWTGPFAFDTQGSNDDCSGAEVFVQEIQIATSASATAHNGTIDGASDSGLAAETCNGSSGTANDDVWFAFVAKTDAVNITFESMDFDGVAVLYSGTCGSLSVVDCSDDTFSASNDTEEINATGLTAGVTYYVRIFNWEASAAADGSFTVKIWSSESLSTEDNDLVEFKLYPNPVQDKLNLRAQDNIENISVYNMLGQEVLRQAPNKNNSEVNMSALQTGSYFVKVTINGITETKQIIKR